MAFQTAVTVDRVSWTIDDYKSGTTANTRTATVGSAIFKSVLQLPEQCYTAVSLSATAEMRNSSTLHINDPARKGIARIPRQLTTTQPRAAQGAKVRRARGTYTWALKLHREAS
ncbi:hypothetical protein Bbelb_002510 [Branchiostoma belcheri]|nr:hypothetical protein Bbelb_002510 [Branchiostoma belcheri]